MSNRNFSYIFSLYILSDNVSSQSESGLYGTSCTMLCTKRKTIVTVKPTLGQPHLGLPATDPLILSFINLNIVNLGLP